MFDKSRNASFNWIKSNKPKIVDDAHSPEMFVSCVVEDFCWPSCGCVVVWSGRKFFVVAMTTAEARLSHIEMIRAALITR